ncbi:hypothetical protein Q1695_014883 [Nippostrongylus brasiliensis]|nr:hypothetical protein Q1695_014883 [Nippostrongylus brasiliensis]
MDYRFADDGWMLQHGIDTIAQCYEQIYKEIETNPVEVTVEEPPVHKFDPDDVPCKQRFFTPPLQYQRNAYVRDLLLAYTNKTDEKIRKLAVLGCGSMSLEKFLMPTMGSIGIERIVSVDIDEHEIARGLKMMKNVEHQYENIFCSSYSLPILFEVYKGDILNYDSRLSGTDCVCSTEVIEHIPRESATRYVRSVLLNIQPTLFVISTPNHEYNEVFGLRQGEFRHADHKFEFTRQEFRNWLYDIIRDFATTYDYAVDYVGVLGNHASLGGATQFAIIRRRPSNIGASLPQVQSRAYKKAGEVVAKNSLFTLEREKVKEAFIRWLRENPLSEENLTKNYMCDFWRVCMTAVLNNIELPRQLKKDLSKKALVDVLIFQCNGRVIYETHDGEIYLNIPHNVTKDELIAIMNSKRS